MNVNQFYGVKRLSSCYLKPGKNIPKGDSDRHVAAVSLRVIREAAHSAGLFNSPTTVQSFKQAAKSHYLTLVALAKGHTKNPKGLG